MENDVMALVVRRHLFVRVKFRNAALPVHTQIQCDGTFTLGVAVGTSSFSAQSTRVKTEPRVFSGGVALSVEYRTEYKTEIDTKSNVADTMTAILSLLQLGQLLFQ
jgi:hypothetical protein